MFILLTIICLVGLVLLRILKKSTYNKKKKMLILFGSGGHTSEILMIFKDYNFKEKCEQVLLMHSNSDTQEPIRVNKYLQDNGIELPNQQWITIPRSRKVKQSYFTSIITTLYSIFQTFILLLKFIDIDIFVTNGPGTCIPVIVVLIIQYFLFIRKKCKILFIESWCRVNNLSVSGKIAYWLSDKFIVNWEELSKKHKKALYVGNLI